MFQGRLGNYRAAVSTVLDAGRAAADELGVGFGLIAAANRGIGVDDATTVATVADTDLLREYEIARSPLGLTDEQLATVASASISGSAAPAELKTAALTSITAWLQD